MSLRRLTDDGRLVDVEPLERVRYQTGRELVPTAAGCPECGGELERSTLKQDALVRHGGYGGTQSTETDRCPGCGFERVAVVATERPPRVKETVEE